MPTVQCRYGQNIHHRQDHRQQCRRAPETLPIPLVGEDVADRQKTAQLLVQFALGHHDCLDLFPIAADLLARQSQTRRDRLEERVVARANLERIASQNANRTVVGKRNLHLTCYDHICAIALNANLYALTCQRGQQLLILIEVAYLFAVECHQSVASNKSGRHSLVGRHAVDLEGHTHCVHILVALLLAHFDKLLQRNGEGVLCTCALNNHLAVIGRNQQLVENLIDFGDLIATDREHLIAVLEAELVSRLVPDVAPLCVLGGHIRLTPMVADSAVDDECQHHVHHHARHHHNQALPSGFRTEFIWLRLGSHLFGVHTFVDHTCDLDVATQRQPTHTVLGLSATELEDREPRVEEQIEFLDANAEHTCGQKVSQLVNNHQQRQTHKELNYFDQNIHNVLLCSCLMRVL